MNGQLHIGQKDKEYTAKEISDLINTDNPDKEISMILAENYPMYRTMVVRRFDNRKDKFVYSIYFRSSYSMITYINGLKEEGKFNSSEDNNEIEETPVENE
jgi:hypothetical protein